MQDSNLDRAVLAGYASRPRRMRPEPPEQKDARPKNVSDFAACYAAHRAGLPANLGELPNMTPGDFAAVRRKAVILGALGDAAELARLLVAASKAKPRRVATIGFMR